MKRFLFPTLALSLLLAGCGSGQFANPFVTSLSVTLTPSTIDATASAPGHVSVTATDGSKNVTGLSVRASSVPAGLSVDVTGSSVTVTPAASTAPGLYPVTLEASVPGGSGDAILSVKVAAVTAPGYTVTITPEGATTTQGTSVHVAATITPDTGFTGKVKVVRVDGSAPGVTVTSDSTGATLVPANNAALGVYTFQLITTDGISEKSTPFSLTVTAPTSS
ncbi:hypothetical protein [Deinococcus ruber]|uniref:Uncharacterized protein n=1 Tax=Deinococcus ruber TaxID=1848197 RepID=A0A918C7H4_9DEIO|nr:hypothetical protein [Deinococcus ruber]GGR09791.1 hypothetical protein GCM10008957_23190 [Deinococcus ruber]